MLALKRSALDGESRDIIATEPHPRAEQLFSACGLKKVTLPPDYSVDIQINIGQTGAAWFLGAKFDIGVLGMEEDVVEKIAHLAHQICPYSKSVRGNIEISTNIVPA